MRWTGKIAKLVFGGAVFLLPVTGLGDGTSLTQLQAQTQARGSYAQCMDYALNGVPGCNQLDCIGANRAFDNVSKSHCILPGPKGTCDFFGFMFDGFRLKPDEWYALGAKKLLIVNGSSSGGQAALDPTHKLDWNNKQSPLDCQSSMNVADLNAKAMNGDADFKNAECEKDENGNCLASPGTLSDGSSSFGLEDGEISRRMQAGESLADIMQSSSFFQSLSPAEQDALLQASEDPDSVLKDLDLKAEGDGSAEMLAGEGNLEGGGGSTPAKPGTLIGDGFSDALADMISGDGIGADGQKPQDATTVEGFDDALNKMQGRGLASKEKLLARKFKSILDRTIFDMVRTRYQAKMPDLVGIEEYLKRQYRRKPADVKALVRGPNRTKL